MHIHIYTDSLCSLQLVPRTGDVGYVINCSGQCTAASSFQYSQCVDLFNILDIQHCNQPECSSKTYNLSACITAETGINTTFTTNQNANCQYNRDRDADTNSIATTEQSQACTPTTIYTETTDKTIIANSSTTAVAALATIVAILIVLLVMVLIALIWTCWTLKIKGTTKSQYQQHR